MSASLALLIYLSAPTYRGVNERVAECNPPVPKTICVYKSPSRDTVPSWRRRMEQQPRRSSPSWFYYQNLYHHRQNTAVWPYTTGQRVPLYPQAPRNYGVVNPKGQWWWSP